ncbi:MAG: 30S ribosomal protein S16 [bacterium]|nr:30S ribosomal protein S16 [bacterium]
MLVIRFNRTGKRNHASFRVVLQEHTKASGKRHIEILGSYDPHKKTTILKKDRILYWMGQGAQASPVVTNLLVREGVIEGKKIAKKMPRPIIKEAVVAPAVADKEVKAEETSAPAVEEVKTEETATVEASVAEEVVAPVVEAVEVPVAKVPVEEVKTTETVPAEAPAEVVVETVVETKEEKPVVVDVPTEVVAEPKA